MVVDPLLEQLLLCELFLLVHQWQRRNQNLRVLLDQVRSQSDKVNIEPLDRPIHGVALNHDHERNASHIPKGFTGDQLEDIRDVKLRVGLLVQDRQLGLASAH